MRGLPVPPSFEELVGWAGEARVTRAGAADLVGWQLPDGHTAALIDSGVPQVEGVIDAVTFRADMPYHRLAELRSAANVVEVFGVEPGTGQVYQVGESGGDIRFVNSSINHWLCSLHLLGTWLSTSLVIGRWDDSEETEEAALAELAELAAGIRALDSAAFEGDDHSSWFWPATLDRWLY